MEALAKQGKWTDLIESEASRHFVGRWQRETAEQVGMGSGDSGRKVQRYLRLNDLCLELLDKVDEKKIPFLSGIELSYLAEEQQKELACYLKNHPCSVTVKQAKILRKLEEASKLNRKSLADVFAQPLRQKNRNVQIPLQHIIGKNAYRFINAVSDFATHNKPLRETANYKENLFMRTLDGHAMIDQAYRMIKAA